MKSRSKTACFFVLFCFAGCKKGDEPKPAAVPSPPAAPVARPPNPEPHRRPPVAALSPEDAKTLLTDDKLSRFATYQKEMLSVTGDTVGVGLQAYAKGGTDQKKFQGAMAADDRSAKIAAANQAALEKSGLTQEEMTKLTHVATRYYAHAYAFREAANKVDELHKKIEDAKASGKQPSVVDVAMEKAYTAQAAQLETVHKEFAAQYGAQTLALMQKHEPEFFAINEKMMGAAIGAMKKK
jgi:hypothetical protein